MTIEEVIVFAIIATTMAMFLWGRVRYDIVAVIALLCGVYAGVVPAIAAFEGFAHPAVITVAAVLIISRALQNGGLVDYLVRFLAPTRRNTTMQVAAASSLGAFLSCFMNNVGALALMLPVTLRNAAKARRSPSLVLMPLSFATLLGGMVTLIGTPPNLLISESMVLNGYAPFELFDFTPIGGAVMVVGVVFVALIGRLMLPKKRADHGRQVSQRSLRTRYKLHERTFLLRVKPREEIPGMLPGMSANAELQFGAGRSSVVVPRDAVLRYADGRTVVWVAEAADGTDRAKERLVETGLSFDRSLLTEGMPLLFVMLLALLVWAAFLPGARTGYARRSPTTYFGACWRPRTSSPPCRWRGNWSSPCSTSASIWSTTRVAAGASTKSSNRCGHRWPWCAHRLSTGSPMASHTSSPVAMRRATTATSGPTC